MLKYHIHCVMSLTFLLHRMEEYPPISSTIGLFIQFPALGHITGLKGVREHWVRHTLVA